MITPAFLTGSRAYGTPRSTPSNSSSFNQFLTEFLNEPSDVDLVLYMKPEEAEAFIKAVDSARGNEAVDSARAPLSRDDEDDLLEHFSGADQPNSHSLRFGELNLIICTKLQDFEAWRSATNALKKRAEREGRRIPRGEAVETIKARLKKVGTTSPPQKTQRQMFEIS